MMAPTCLANNIRYVLPWTDTASHAMVTPDVYLDQTGSGTILTLLAWEPGARLASTSKAAVVIVPFFPFSSSFLPLRTWDNRLGAGMVRTRRVGQSLRLPFLPVHHDHDHDRDHDHGHSECRNDCMA